MHPPRICRSLARKIGPVTIAADHRPMPLPLSPQPTPFLHSKRAATTMSDRNSPLAISDNPSPIPPPDARAHRAGASRLRLPSFPRDDLSDRHAATAATTPQKRESRLLRFAFEAQPELACELL